MNGVQRVEREQRCDASCANRALAAVPLMCRVFGSDRVAIFFLFAVVVKTSYSIFYSEVALRLQKKIRREQGLVEMGGRCWWVRWVRWVTH